MRGDAHREKVNNPWALFYLRHWYHSIRRATRSYATTSDRWAASRYGAHCKQLRIRLRRALALQDRTLRSVTEQNSTYNQQQQSGIYGMRHPNYLARITVPPPSGTESISLHELFDRRQCLQLQQVAPALLARGTAAWVDRATTNHLLLMVTCRAGGNQ